MWISADFNCKILKTQSADVKDILTRSRNNRKKLHSLNSSFKRYTDNIRNSVNTLSHFCPMNPPKDSGCLNCFL